MADDHGLLADADQSARAATDLTHPAKRLTAEVAWFPGLAPRKVESLLKSVLTDPKKTLDTTALDPLCICNLQCELLADWKVPITIEEGRNLLFSLCDVFEGVDIKNVRNAINADRTAAGIPEIQSDTPVADAILARRKFYRQVMLEFLDLQKSSVLVDCVGRTVDEATSSGEKHGPILLEELIDGYEIRAKPFLQGQSLIVLKEVAKLEAMAKERDPDNEFFLQAEELKKSVRRWHRVARPIQLVRKSQGLEYAESRMLAFTIRNLAVDLYNNYAKLEFSKLLTELVSEIFEEDRVVAEKTAEDTKYLKDIEQNKIKSEAETAALSYKAVFGTFIKDHFSINVDVINWKGKFWKTAEVSGVAWGGINRYVNKAYQGTEYTITFSDAKGYGEIKLIDKEVYEAIIERLWKVVAVRLLFDMTKKLKNGEKLRFGGATLDDRGIELGKNGFISNSNSYFTWDQTSIWSENGNFLIRSSKDNQFRVQLSYISTKNTHVLEFLIRAAFKRGIRTDYQVSPDGVVSRPILLLSTAFD